MNKLKTLFLSAIIALTVAGIVYAWTNPSGAPPTGGGALYYSGDNVGIGTTTPAYKLDVAGALRLQPSSAPTGKNGVIYYDSTSNKFKCYQNGSWVDCISVGGSYWAADGNNIYNTNSDNVGIGTTTPAYKLDVAGNIRAQISLTAGINVQSLSADKTLTPGIDKMYQYLVPGSANRTITLATTNAKAGDRFIIRNNDNDTSSYYLEIKQGATVLDYIYTQSTKEYIFNGTSWVSADAGTKTGGEYGLALGYSAMGYNSGTALGYNTQGYNFGVAVGYAAAGSNSGAAVGYQAYGYDYGVAVGSYTSGYSYGTAVGYYTSGSNSGAAVGYNALGSNSGAAVGFNASGSNYGAAVGNGAYGSSYGAAVGSGAKGVRYGAALGYQAGYNISDSADRYNVVVGAYSGYRLTTGIGNIILGYQSGYDSTYSPTSGSYNILIGYKSWTPANTTSNFLNIGGLIFGTNLSTTTNAISSGNVGIRITNPNYTLHVNGSFAASSKNFDIVDPRYHNEKYRLIHSTLEGPEYAVFYRGEAKLENGKAIIKLPDYFETLTRKEGRTVLLTAKGAEPFSLSASEVKEGKFEVYGTKLDGEFYWEVKAVRADLEILKPEVIKSSN